MPTKAGCPASDRYTAQNATYDRTVDKRYSSQGIRDAVDRDRERLFADWRVGRPEGWTTDGRTSDLVCLAKWLRLEMEAMGLDDAGRRVQEAQFNRRSRSEDDLFQVAADVINDAAEGRIDRDRRPHRRWG